MNKNNDLIKIGIMIDSFEIPIWANIMIDEITKLDHAEISVLIVNNNYKNKLNGKFKKDQERSILFDFYLSYEKKRFYQKNKLCQNIQCDKFKNIKEIEVIPIKKNTFNEISKGDILKIKEFGLDIIIRLGFNRLSGNILSIPKYGIWSFFKNNNYHQEIKFNGFWEIFRDQPVNEVNLYLNGNNSLEDKIIAQAFTSTDQLYITRNNVNKYWKNIELILNKIQEIYLSRNPDRILLDKRKKKEDFDHKYEKHIPNNKEIIQFSIKHWINYLKIKRKFRHKTEQWGIMFDFNENSFASPKNCNKIIPPEDRYYADPFIIKKNDEYFVFIEEVLYNHQKGHISYFKIDKNGKYELPKKILESNYHMSYPFVFKFENEYYMIPETSENRSVDLYKCKKFPEQWEFKKNIMKNVNASDSTLLRKDDKWWLFTSIPFMESSSNDTLSIFYSDNLFADKWNPLPTNPVISDIRKSRSAGKIFQINNEYYRPSQDGSKGYGRGVVFNKIITLNESEYSEKTVESIYPDFDKTMEGIHTFNKIENFRIFDFKKLKKQ